MKDSTKKGLIYGLSALALIGISLWGLKKFGIISKAKSSDQPGGNQVPDPTDPSYKVNYCDQKAQFPLQKGSKGEEVGVVQRALNKSFNMGLTEDCVWGSKTQRKFESVVAYLGLKSAYDSAGKVIPRVLYNELLNRL